MPPKRKDVPKGDETANKKQKKDDTTVVDSVALKDDKPKVSSPPKVVDKSDDSDDEKDGKPWCQYGIGCYRKNPDHLKNFRHPSKKSKDEGKDDTKDSKGKLATKDKNTSKDKDKEDKDKDKDKDSDNNDKDATSSKTSTVTVKGKGKQDSDTDNQTLENYKSVLQCALAKNKISVDEKRMLRTYRRNNAIEDVDHFRLIQQFGWTADEYEDGQRKDDDCDLDEERGLLEKNQLTILSIKKAKNMPKEHDIVFSRVCAKFFQTMSKAQSNYIITEVGIIVNPEARKKFNMKKQELTSSNLGNIEWAFHGTTRDSIKAIAETGFLHPDALKKLKATKSGGKQTKAKKVKLLDDGFFGKGIYLSFYADYAMFYSEERKSDQVLLSQVLPGKSFRCSGRMDGADCQKGYHSHYSPKGNEMVVFDPVQILPRYVITFAANPDQEREQEV